MRVSSSIVIRAPRESVWDTLTDPGRYPEFMSGITRWELIGRVTEPGATANPDDADPPQDPDRIGLGSRIRMLIRVGSAEVGGLIEVVEAKRGSDMAWSSVTGIDQRGRWRVRDASPGCTRVELRYSYGIAGAGMTGMLAEQVSAPILRRRLRQSLLGLKRMVESERAASDTRTRASAEPVA